MRSVKSSNMERVGKINNNFNRKSWVYDSRLTSGVNVKINLGNFTSDTIN